MHHSLGSLIGSYGFAVLFALVALESLGVPLPGETALVTAAAYAGAGRLSIELVILTAMAAAIVGDNGGYWIGRKGGIALVHRYGRFLHLRESHLEKAQRFFAKYGGKTVFFGRFIALLRTWAAILAGAACMPYGMFTMYNALGGIVWSVAFGTLGYLFGRNLPLLEHYIGQASLAMVLLVALCVGLVLAARWFAANRAAVTDAVWEKRERITSMPAIRSMQTRHPGFSRFLTARFARGEYLGLHLTIGMLVSLAGLWLFGGVTEDVINGDPLTRFDETLLRLIRLHATPFGDSVFRIVTLLGSPVVIGLIGLAVALFLAAKKEWIPLGGWSAAYVGAGILDFALKHVIQRPRPPGASLFLNDASYSFPSGHAMGSLVGYGMVAYVLVLHLRDGPRRAGVIAAAVLLVVTIGLSRLYLGVHYFSDVVGGYAAGLLWLSACISGTEIARRKRDVDGMSFQEQPSTYPTAGSLPKR